MTNIITAVVTAYCACTHCCGPKATGLAANGKPPIEGISVAASRSYPLGTVIYIEGFTNRFVVHDRLAKKYDSRVDIYMQSHQQALKWGKQTRKVMVVK